MEVLFFVLSSLIISVSSANINSFIEPKTLFSFTGPFNTKLIDSIAAGVQLAMDQCRKDFKWEKWNCPESTFLRQSNTLVTKELAYSKAMLSAGIVYTITQNCSRGEIPECGCDPRKTSSLFNFTAENTLPNFKTSKNNQDWIWGGCSDDVSYGSKIAKLFLSGLEKGNDVITSVGRQNHHIGRKVVQSLMHKKCHCHGMFCPLQTCWMQMPAFEEVSKKLKYKYKRAVNIDLQNGVHKYNSNNFRRSPNIQITGNEDYLMYLEESPDFCLPNVIKNWPGTIGRRCSRSRSKLTDISERKSCKNLCKSCGHSIMKVTKKVVKRCNCHFRWCCDVKCDICEDEVEEFVCV